MRRDPAPRNSEIPPALLLELVVELQFSVANLSEYGHNWSRVRVLRQKAEKGFRVRVIMGGEKNTGR